MDNRDRSLESSIADITQQITNLTLLISGQLANANISSVNSYRKPFTPTKERPFAGQQGVCWTCGDPSHISRSCTAGKQSGMQQESQDRASSSRHISASCV